MSHGQERHPCVRIGIDVGGTFTDLVLALSSPTRVFSHKEPSTPGDPSEAVASGLETILDLADIRPDCLTSVVHGTTLGLNTLLQRKGVRTALIVSTGNRDVFELGRARMPSPYDFSLQKETPLVPRRRIFEANARAGANGEVLAEPDTAEIDRLAEAIAHSGAAAVSICLLNAYRNAAIEDRLAKALGIRLPGIPITRSSHVWPEIREYERATLATMNAYLQPPLAAYFQRLRQRITGLDIHAPIYITTSNGGTVDLETASERPVETLLSGPASGVVAAAVQGATADRRNLITVDMGGTSCDTAVVEDAEPLFTTATHIGDFPFVAPVVAVSAIGAGGGSIVRHDSHGILKVGPDSAGAEPGPACYGRGGSQPTITDCYVALGIIDPAKFLDGRLRLDAGAARDALIPVAKGIGLDGEDAHIHLAAAALEVATAGMATELYKSMAQRGLDPRQFTLVAYGGAGPTQAGLLAEEAGLESVLIPPLPATFCAAGAVASDLKRDYVATLRIRLDADGARDRIAAACAGLRDKARAWLARLAGEIERTSELFLADMRYAGQAYELPVDISAHTAVDDPSCMAESFHAAHEERYGFRDADSPVELINLRLRAVGTGGALRISPPPGDGQCGTPRAAGSRRVFLGRSAMDAPVFERGDLDVGSALDGPALVDQADTTVVVPAGWHLRVDPHLNLDMRRATAVHNTIAG